MRKQITKSKKIKILFISVVLFVLVIATVIFITLFNYSKKRNIAIDVTDTYYTNVSKPYWSNWYKDNKCMFEQLFLGNYDFSNPTDKLLFTKKYYLFNHADNSKIIELNKKNYLTRESLKNTYQILFNDSFDENNYVNTKSEEKFYNTGAVFGGGTLEYYPVINKIINDQTKKTLTLSIIDYQELNFDLSDYENVIEVTDEKIGNLKDNINYLVITIYYGSDNTVIENIEYIHNKDFERSFLNEIDVVKNRVNSDFIRELSKSKEDIAKFLKENRHFFAKIFPINLKTDNHYDFEQLNVKLAFVHDFLLWNEDSKYFLAEDEDQNSTDIYINESMLQQLLKNMFNYSISSEELNKLEYINEKYYLFEEQIIKKCTDIYFPMLNKITYDSENEIYHLYLLNYKDYDSELLNYEKVLQVTDKELEGKEVKKIKISFKKLPYDRYKLLQILNE